MSSHLKSSFSGGQNFLQIEGNLKLIISFSSKNTKEIITDKDGMVMGKDCED